jgi:hypothetical protein
MEYCEAGSLEDIYKRARDLGGIIGEPVLERIAESVNKKEKRKVLVYSWLILGV